MATIYAVRERPSAGRLKRVTYICPDCGGKFVHVHHLSDLTPPDRCELCGAWMSEDEPPQEVFEPQAPAIKSSDYAKSVDQSYRAMEEQSAARADEAADQLESWYQRDDKENPHQGDPALLDDFKKNQIAELKSGIKITDMKDPSQMRPGDTAAILPATSVAAQRLSIGASKPGFQEYVGGSGTGGATSALSHLTGHKGWENGSPPAPNPVHNARAAAMVRQGQMNAYRRGS